jgi:hypothetical protein
MTTIWVTEQIDPCGILYTCIASSNEQHARDCHESFQANLTPSQKAKGWIATIRPVQSWDDVPVAALKLG